MRAFEVYLNQRKLCRAGIGDDGVLTAIVCWATRKDPTKRKDRRELFLQVGGLVSPANEHVRWVRQKPLQVGDRIQVRIVETRSVDRPVQEIQFDRSEDVNRQKRYVRMMARKFGWKIQSRPR